MSYIFYAEFEVGEVVFYNGATFTVSEIYITVVKGDIFKDYILRDIRGYEVPYPIDEKALIRVTGPK